MKCDIKGCNREVSSIESYRIQCLCQKHGEYQDRKRRNIEKQECQIKISKN